MKKYEEKINSFIEKEKDNIYRDLNSLIEVRSVSKDDEYSPFGRECRLVADKAIEISGKLGLETENHSYYGVSTLLGTTEKEIAILTHLDIVPESDGWSVPPFSLTRRDGLIFGRGVMDDKGPTVMILYAMKFLKELRVNLNYKYRLFMGCSEERDMRCIDYYVENVKQPEFAFSPDGRFPVCGGEKGIIDLIIETDCPEEIESIEGGEAINIVPGKCKMKLKKDIDMRYSESYVEIDGRTITTKGKSAHGGVPEEGINAIYLMLDFVRKNCELSERTRELLTEIIEMCDIEGKGFCLSDFKDETGKTTANLGRIYKKENKLYLEFNIRYPVYVDSKEVQGNILGKMKELNFNIIKNKDNKPCYIDINSKEVEKLLDAIKIVTGKNEKPYFSSGGTYARKVKKAVAFGPELIYKSFGNPHMVDECMYEKDFFDGIKIYIYSLLLLNEI